MSSILRALKKLENEPRHLEETRSLDSKFVPLADTRPQKKFTGLLIWIIGGVLVFGFVVIAGGWWLLSEKKQAPDTTPELARQQTASPPVIQKKSPLPPKPDPAAGSKPSPRAPAQPAKQVMQEQTTDRLPEPTSITLPQPATPKVEQQKVLPIARQPVEATILSSVAPEAENVEPAATAESVKATKGSEQTSLEQVEKTEIPVLRDDGVKLQAITWSKDPQKRIAVINNSILRQGETVAGYRIETINQDDVVLNDRGKQWKLLFRIR